MLDHIEIFVRDASRSRAFYDNALKPLGLTVVREVGTTVAALGYGSGAPFFWVTPSPTRTGRLHVAFAARTRENGGRLPCCGDRGWGQDNGAPGLRELYAPNYYGAYVLDPDGHNIEAVCRSPA